ncbi:ABC transporter ATP-binding protein [Halobacillus sp. BBL2006]|uniref:ABC transporter ATP-binding protein n=1 Tax=Halobacillus sp. BBL2006 TaxID=1543706 RepID=UPI000541C629|nr:ABC transporter ATP-binding protein [Halobacillus sp. BBL2006]KHE68169.1 ABC transporter ATP-binding protein [Halobacillus sp. BBL2006]
MSKLLIENLSMSFEGKSIIRKISLHVNEGEFVSILGPSGSGKSTLFHLVGGLYNPDEGRILLNNKDITGQKGSISYMPQSPALFPWRTLVDNVLLGGEIKGDTDREAALNMIEKAGLSGYENNYPSQLSGGMKQRASFIRSLLSPQSLICLDEPFSALDEFTRIEMQEWLLSIWEEHQKSILFVTHNIEEALFLSDRVIVLSDRPARVVEEFEVPFPRPREQSILLTTEFLEWKKEIFQKLQVLA